MICSLGLHEVGCPRESKLSSHAGKNTGMSVFVFHRILVVCVSPGDLSGDAPEILRSGTCTVCRVRDELSLWTF